MAFFDALTTGTTRFSCGLVAVAITAKRPQIRIIITTTADGWDYMVYFVSPLTTLITDIPIPRKNPKPGFPPTGG